MKTGGVCTYSDRLVAEFTFPDGSKARQGKRIADKYRGILTREEIRTYVEHGTIRAVRIIKESRGIDLSSAKALLDQTRGGKYAGRFAT